MKWPSVGPALSRAPKVASQPVERADVTGDHRQNARAGGLSGVDPALHI
jgi:hypothetical protein